MNIIAPLLFTETKRTKRHPGSFCDRLAIAGTERARTGGKILIPVPDNDVWEENRQHLLGILRKHHCDEMEVAQTFAGPDLKDQIRRCPESPEVSAGG